MFRSVLISGDERKRNAGFGNAGKFDFRFFRRFFDTLHCCGIFGQIDAVVFLELVDYVVHDTLVEVVAAETGVAVCRKDFEHAVADFKNGYVERAAAQIVNKDFLVFVFFLIETVCKRCRRRFVNDTQNFKSCDFARVFRCLTLAVREVCGDGDNGLRYFLSEICFRVRFKFRQNHCRDFLRRIFFVVDFYFVIGAHFTLDAADGSCVVRDSLTFCDVAHKTFAVF